MNILHKPIIHWPRRYRWTLGVLFLLLVVIPFGLFLIVWNVAGALCRVLWNDLFGSSVWLTMTATAGAVLLGTEDKNEN